MEVFRARLIIHWDMQVCNMTSHTGIRRERGASTIFIVTSNLLGSMNHLHVLTHSSVRWKRTRSIDIGAMELVGEGEGMHCLEMFNQIFIRCKSARAPFMSELISGESTLKQKFTKVSNEVVQAQRVPSSVWRSQCILLPNTSAPQRLFSSQAKPKSAHWLRSTAVYS